MSDGDREIRRMAVGLTADTVATAVIIVWGLAYLLAAALAPGLIGNVSTALSAGSMALIGLLLLWSVVRGSRLLTGLMALVEIGLMVGSWTGTIRWAVPYDPELAAVSMAGMDFIVAVALVFKTIQLIDIEIGPRQSHRAPPLPFVGFRHRRQGKHDRGGVNVQVLPPRTPAW